LPGAVGDRYPRSFQGVDHGGDIAGFRRGDLIVPLRVEVVMRGDKNAHFALLTESLLCRLFQCWNVAEGKMYCLSI
jgi:hypothetical protein